VELLTLIRRVNPDFLWWMYSEEFEGVIKGVSTWLKVSHNCARRISIAEIFRDTDGSTHT
jgi:hypothetical protein